MRNSWRRRVILGLFLTLFPVADQAGTNNMKDAPNIFTVHVRNYAHVDLKTLAEAEEAAGNIFRHAVLEARWEDQPIVSPLEIQAEDADSRSFIGPSHLWLNIYPRSMADVLGLPDNVMGVAPGTGSDRQLVYVFYDSVERLACRQVISMRKGDITRPATRAQILGHMIAHEIGHVLLNLPCHSALGIMRGDWNLKDLQDIAYGSLLFTPQQNVVLRAEAARRAQQTVVSVSEQHDLTR